MVVRIVILATWGYWYELYTIQHSKLWDSYEGNTWDGNAESFMNLFGEEIEDALREAIRNVIRRHYEWWRF